MSATIGTRSLAEASRQPDNTDWDGPKVPYDLAKEFVIALVAVAVLVVVLAVVFSSPNERPVTIRQWATNTTSTNSKFPGQDFVATALTELDGSSVSAGYGPPYNNNGTGQKLGPVSLQQAVGVHIPVDPANDFVLSPLHLAATSDPALAAALARYESASPAQQQKWTSAYESALATASLGPDGTIKLAPGRYGPVPVMMDRLLRMARTGALDNSLLASQNFYGTDYTKPLLFIADGQFLADKAQAQHLSGDQWGMMNETGNFPGQAWLWLYTMWYQVPPMNSSSNGDVEVWAIMMVLTLFLLFLPFIPGLRSIPRWIPVYRGIWRDHYRALDAEERTAGAPRAPPPS
jgi:hypothetical protein